MAPFTLEINFEILFRNFSFRSIYKHFHIGNKLSKANINDAVDAMVDASFDVCKHWLTDQSKRSISEISLQNSQNRTFSKLRNKISKFISFESWLFTLEIFLQK